MSKELVTPEGLRYDGRRIGELRKISIEINNVPDADGSCIFTLGNTKVLATVYGPNDLLRVKNPLQASISVEYNVAPYAGNERRLPASSQPQVGQIANNTCKEYSIELKKLFDSVIMLHKWPNSSIQISVTVLSDQGSAFSTSINAITVALMMAGIDMIDLVTASTCCIYDNQPLIDVTSREAGLLGGLTTLAVFNMRGYRDNATGLIEDEIKQELTENGSIIVDDKPKKQLPPTKKIALLHHTQKTLLNKLQLSLDAGNYACTIIHDLIKQTVRQYMIDQVVSKQQ